jgi:hypothetical protein
VVLALQLAARLIFLARPHFLLLNVVFPRKTFPALRPSAAHVHLLEVR